MGGFNSGRRPNPKLSQQVVKLRARGLTFSQIAERLGVTKQRAHQIIVASLRADQGAARKPDLSIARILAWADCHFQKTGQWPTTQSGPVLDAPGETWSAIKSALQRGYRGLPGGITLARLIQKHRPGASVRVRRLTRKQK